MCINTSGPRQHLEQMHDVFSKLPKRNLWPLMGDLNTSLQKCGPSTGLPDYAIDGRRSQGPIYRDSAQLHNLIRIYDMIALNTWKHDLGPTFQFENKHSRIDFIFCKRHLVDAGAREAHYLQHFPLLKLTGAIHYPVLCTVLKAWTPDPSQPST